MSSTSKTDAKINDQKKKVDLAIAELKKLERQKKDEERKEQAARTGKRGVLLEKLLPDTAKLDDTCFKRFLEITIANDFGKSKLKLVLAEQAKASTTEVKSASTQNNSTQPAKPIKLQEVDETVPEEYVDYQ